MKFYTKQEITRRILAFRNLNKRHFNQYYDDALDDLEKFIIGNVACDQHTTQEIKRWCKALLVFSPDQDYAKMLGAFALSFE